MERDVIIEQLRKRFGKRQSFSRQELYDFYTEFKPDLKETTFRWIIFNLKEKQILTSISKGLFTLSFKPVFKPNIDKAIKRIYTSVEKQFSTLKFCLWTTEFASEFMLHITAKHITILQMEKEALEPVYAFLKTKKLGNTFIQPEEKEIERYIYESDKAIVLLPLVSKSPLQNIDSVQTTTIEKLIVDLFSDKKLFAAYQGAELAHIVNTAHSRYAIDFTTLFHYANRRRKDVELKKFLKDKTDIPSNILND